MLPRGVAAHEPGLVRHLHHYVPVGLVGLISWTVWLTRFTLSGCTGRSRRASRRRLPSWCRPTGGSDIIDRCVTSWLRENPTEIIVVPDVADTEVIARLEARAAVDPRLKVVPFVHHGKRSALGSPSVTRARKSWCCATRTRAGSQACYRRACAVRRPAVGGVGTRQNPYQAETSVWRRMADWMIDVRYLDYVRAQSAAARRLPIRPDRRLPPPGRAAGAREPGG